MPETLEFDPTAEASGSPLAFTLGSGTTYYLTAQDYPAPPLVTVNAGSIDTEGERLAARKHGLRQITHRWDVRGTSTATLETAVDALTVKIAKLAREGGTLKRTSAGGTVRTYDILAADDYGYPIDITYDIGFLAQVSYTLTAKPYSRGPEVDLGDNVNTTLPVLGFTEATVPGHVPALGRLVIDNDHTVSRQGLLAAIRSYGAGEEVQLFYEGEEQTPYSGVTTVADGTASGGSIARHSSLTTSYLPVVGPASNPAHLGVYRIFARVRCAAANAGVVTIRWRYSASADTTNTPVVLPSGADDGNWFFVNLGEMHLPKAKSGLQAWTGFIEAKSTVAGDDFDVDYTLLAPVEEAFAIIEGNATFPALPAGATSASQWRHDGYIAQIPALTGRYFDRTVKGDYLLVPPSGAEARTLGVILKMYPTHFGDASVYPTVTAPVVADGGVGEDLSARLFVTPRYLT